MSQILKKSILEKPIFVIEAHTQSGLGSILLEQFAYQSKRPQIQVFHLSQNPGDICAEEEDLLGFQGIKQEDIVSRISSLLLCKKV